jgi:hypothetical protein
VREETQSKNGGERREAAHGRTIRRKERPFVGFNGSRAAVVATLQESDAKQKALLQRSKAFAEGG